MGGCRRGIAIISPVSTFAIFNNTTAFSRLAATQESRKSLPCQLIEMGFAAYERHVSGEVPPKYYSQEHYYFQGPLSGSNLQRILTLPVFECSGKLSPGRECASLPEWLPKFTFVLLEHDAAWERMRAGVDPLRQKGCKADFNQGMLRVMKQGSKHALHFDDSDSVFFQIAGKKEVTLIPVMQLAYMYPYRGDDFRARRAQISLETPDPAQYPMSAFLQPVHITLMPGDVLLVPRRSGHETVAKSDSMTVTFRLNLWCQTS